MKKLIALLVSMIVGSAVFADYRGDLQIRPIGFGTNTFEATDIDVKSDATSYNFGVQSYNTWGAANSPFKFGFSVGFDLGFLSGDEGEMAEDGGISCDFTVGPAVSFKINKIVKLETAIMLGFLAYEEDHTSCDGVGVVWDFVAEFLPEAVFSPLVGVNYMSTSVNVSFDDNTPDLDADFSRFKFFIGGAFNFGRRN